jgi:hypothetical protein
MKKKNMRNSNWRENKQNSYKRAEVEYQKQRGQSCTFFGRREKRWG